MTNVSTASTAPELVIITEAGTFIHYENIRGSLVGGDTVIDADKVADFIAGHIRCGSRILPIGADDPELPENVPPASTLLNVWIPAGTVKIQVMRGDGSVAREYQWQVSGWRRMERGYSALQTKANVEIACETMLKGTNTWRIAYYDKGGVEI